MPKPELAPLLNPQGNPKEGNAKLLHEQRRRRQEHAPSGSSGACMHRSARNQPVPRPRAATPRRRTRRRPQLVHERGYGVDLILAPVLFLPEKSLLITAHKFGRCHSTPELHSAGA
ncbi:hypothetical protein DL768_006086 [Monosporascus sp. mg162]|nr:hypothetical protein DL768_006086 [Monosporascus sp. mg162]